MTGIVDIILDAQHTIKPTFREYLAAREILTVKDTEFGAVGDGVANDTAAVQAALAAAAGTALYFPSGRYRIQSPLAWPNDTLFFGNGASSVLEGHVSSANFSTSVGQTGTMMFEALRFESAGTYSMVMTFTDCGRVAFGPGCSGDFTVGGDLGSIFIRSYGTREIIVAGQYGNVDSFIYGDALHTGTAQAGAAATITLASSASASDDYYNTRLITIISGTGSGQNRTITDYNGTTKVATVSAWGTQPDATSVYTIQNTGHIIVKSSARFWHDFVGTTNNPTVVYQFNCDKVTVESGARAQNIAAGGGAPISGYFVYQGDGDPDCEVDVGAAIMEMTVVKPAVMVQASTARRVRHEGRFFGKALGATGANYHFNGGGAQSELDIGGYSEQGAIFVVGGGSLATAVRHARIRTVIRKLEQNTAAIRCGVLGTNYVDLVVLDHPFSYCTYASGISLSQINRLIAIAPIVRNWNTQNYATPTVYAYTAGIFIDATPASAIIRDPICENDTTVAGEEGFCRVAIAASNAGAHKNIRVFDARIGTMLDSEYVNLIGGSGEYTPTATLTANLDGATPAATYYERNEDNVHVAGVVTIDPTAAGPTTTQLGLSLPAASNFAASSDAAGSAHSTATQDEHYAIYADVVNDRVVVDGLAKSAAAHAIWFNFTYRIK